MTDARPTLPAPGTTGLRPATPREQAHLEQLRAHVRASGVDVLSPDALGDLVHRTYTSWAGSGAPVPDGTVAALGVALGDLVVQGAPGARWVLRTAGNGPTPAVASESGDAVVLPLDDIRARWDSGCAPEWAAGYVAAAAAHLTAVPSAPVASLDPAAGAPPTGPEPHLPTPRASSEGQTVADVPVDSPVAAEHAPGAPAPAGSPRTPADLPFPPSSTAQDLALQALDRALEAVLADPATARPFAVVLAGDLVHVEEFDDVSLARAWVRASGASGAAVAWQGTTPDDDAPAVLVEACDARRPSLRIAHRYSPARPAGTGRARPARPVGEPVVLGNGAALL